MHIGQFPIEILFQDDFKFCKDDSYKYLSHVKPHVVLLGEVCVFCGALCWGKILFWFCLRQGLTVVALAGLKLTM